MTIVRRAPSAGGRRRWARYAPEAGSLAGRAAGLGRWPGRARRVGQDGQFPVEGKERSHDEAFPDAADPRVALGDGEEAGEQEASQVGGVARPRRDEGDAEREHPGEHHADGPVLVPAGAGRETGRYMGPPAGPSRSLGRDR
jgi:hypothetical protein